MEFNKTVQIGNFLLRKEKADDRAYIKIWTASNNWSMTYWENNNLFPLLNTEADDEEGKQGLSVFFTNLYTFATQVEADFIKDQIKIISEYVDRVASSAQPVSDEEDAEILQSQKTLYEINQQIKEQGGKL